jgi:2',3'-cyclic-nucleotide 2'-phosphodiesterase (5'-nucleotidase family)
MFKTLFFQIIVFFVKSELIKISILGTNDLHGRLTPIRVVKPNNLTINLGGLSLFSSYLNILK